MTSVYILRLEGGKWYVGRSAQVARRVMQHFTGNGALWTQKYKPVALHAVHASVDNFDEDTHVKRMMSKWGIDNVRGGAYSTFTIDDPVKAMILRELRNANDECFSCGSKLHFTSKCTVIGETSRKRRRI